MVMTGETERVPEKTQSRPLSLSRQSQVERLAAEHSGLVFRIACLVTRDRQEAEDVTQEVFLKLLRSADLSEIADEKAYMARCAWRMATGRRRREVEPGDAFWQQTASLSPSPEALAIEQNRVDLLRRMIAALPPELREPLQLSTVQELSSRQVGEVLGVPEGTVRTRLMRARQQLKQRLEAMMGGLGNELEG